MRSAVAALAVLLLAAIVLGYQAVRQPEPAVTAFHCEDVVAGCAIPGAGVRVYFDRVPQPMQRFRLQVEWPEARAVQVSFSMQGMEMGLNRYRLLAQGSGRWTAEVMLPACVRGRSDWVMQLASGEERHAIGFSAR